MLFSPILGLLATATLTTAIPADLTPRGVSLAQMQADLHNTEGCNLNPGNNCAGILLQDVIISYEKDTEDRKKFVSMYMNATTAAGGKIAHEYNGLSFSGFVPDQVLTLIEAHGKTAGLKVVHNACMGVPWCGEAPC